jgi:hypothetical protein
MASNSCNLLGNTNLYNILYFLLGLLGSFPIYFFQYKLRQQESRDNDVKEAIIEAWRKVQKAYTSAHRVFLQFSLAQDRPLENELKDAEKDLNEFRDCLVEIGLIKLPYDILYKFREVHTCISKALISINILVQSSQPTKPAYDEFDKIKPILGELEGLCRSKLGSK